MRLRTAFFRTLEWRCISMCMDFVIWGLLTHKWLLAFGGGVLSNFLKITAQTIWLKHRTKSEDTIKPA